MPIVLTKTCPNCHKTEDIVLDNERYVRWKTGEHIQNVWPEKTPAEREQMMTGLCSDECFEEYLGPEPD